MKKFSLAEMLLLWVLLILFSFMIYSMVNTVNESKPSTICPHCKK